MRVCVGIPTMCAVGTEVYYSHLNLMCSIGRRAEVVIPHVSGLYPHDRAREAIVDAAVQQECNYLLFVDADMHTPAYTFNELLRVMQENKCQMTTAHAYRRAYPYTPVWAKVHRGEAFQVTTPKTGLPEQIESTGMAGNLIDVRWCVEHIPRPWFRMVPQDDGILWEDAYFCQKFHEFGGKLFTVPSVRLGHAAESILVNDGNHGQLRKWSNAGLISTTGE